MPQTLTNVGRLAVAFPDRGYDAQIDGGIALHAALTNTIKTLSDNIATRWYDNFALSSSQTTTLTHNLGLALTSIKVLIMESGVLKTQTEVSARYTIAQVSTSAISIQNISGGSITNIQVYIIGYPLGIKSSDIDATIDATVTRLRFSSGVLLNEMAAPSTPSSGQVAMYAKSDKKIYTKDSNGVESQVGSGSSTGINYFSNSDLENGSTTGISTYKDAAQSTPVDGTGGTATITITASNSSPLRGTYSLVITKPASNVQGEGVAFDLSVPAVDSGKTVQAIFDITNPNLTSGDITLNLYDVTNSVLISSSIILPTGTSSQYTKALNLSTGTSYRLCLHFATTSTAAATIKMDTIIVTPKITPIVAGISDWIAYPTTLSAGLGGTTSTFYYRRVGDTIEIEGFPTIGTVAASLASFTLPANLTINTAKRGSSNTTANPGQDVGFYTFTPANNTGRLVTATGTSTNTIYFANLLGSASGTLTPANGSSITASSSTGSINVKVPIAQWSSDITLSSTNGALQFASNSTITDANDTTAFIYGSLGSPLPGTLTALRTKRVQLSSPYSSIDDLDLFIIPATDLTPIKVGNGLIRNNAGTIIASPLTIQNTTTYGVGIQPVSGSKTQIDVVFGQYSHPSGATFASAGSNWVTGNANWFVKSRSSIGGAELAPATMTSQGTVAYSQTTASGIIAANFTGFGTPTSVNIYMRREGDYLILSGGFTSSSNTAVTAKMLLPSVNGTALNIDTTKIVTKATNDCHVLGHGYLNQAGTGAFLGYNITFLADSTDNTSIYFSTNHNLNIPTQPATGINISTGLYRISELKIPILGWS